MAVWDTDDWCDDIKRLPRDMNPDIQILQRLVRAYPMEAIDAVRHLEVAPEPRECPECNGMGTAHNENCIANN